MSTLKIEDQFELAADPDRVFRFLLDPEQVVVCLPGAALEAVEGDTTFLGNMKVKVGPITVTYKGKVELVEVDHANRTVRMDGKGTEKGGSGTASMQMTSRVIELPDGAGSRVEVESDVQLAGRIVRFGRGMIKGVSEQLFKQFTKKVSEKMAEAPDEDEIEVETEAAPTDAAPAEAAGEASAPAEVTEAPDKPVRREIEPVESEPIRAIPLFFKVLWTGIKRFFARLFGRAPRD